MNDDAEGVLRDSLHAHALRVPPQDAMLARVLATSSSRRRRRQLAATAICAVVIALAATLAPRGDDIDVVEQRTASAIFAPGSLAAVASRSLKDAELLSATELPAGAVSRTDAAEPLAGRSRAAGSRASLRTGTTDLSLSWSVLAETGQPPVRRQDLRAIARRVLVDDQVAPVGLGGDGFELYVAKVGTGLRGLGWNEEGTIAVVDVRTGSGAVSAAVGRRVAALLQAILDR